MVSGTAYIGFTEALILVSQFVTAVFLARFLGPKSFGLFMLTATFVIWLEWSITAVFSSATVKFVGETVEWKTIGSMIVRVHLIASLCACILVWLLAEPVAGLLNEKVLADYLKLFAIEIPLFGMARAQGSIMVGLGDFKKRAFISAMRSVSRLILIVVLVTMGLSVLGAIMGSIVATAIEAAVGRYYVRVPFFAKTNLSFRGFWQVAGPLFMSTMSLRLFRLDLFALKALGATAAQAGFYSVAKNLSLPPTVYSKSVSPTLLATMSRLLSQGDVRKASEIGANVLRSICWLLPFVTMVAAMAEEIVSFVFGSAFVPAGRIFSLLIFETLAFVTIKICTAILTALGKQNWTFRITGPMVPFAILGHLLLIPRFGPIGAAVVTTTGASLASLAAVFTVFLSWEFAIPKRTIVYSLMCSALALLTAVIWPAQGILVLLKMSIISTTIIAAFLLLREFTSTELAFIRSLVKSRLSLGQGYVRI